MPTTTATAEYKKVKALIDKYEKNPLTPEKIKRMRSIISLARLHERGKYGMGVGKHELKKYGPHIGQAPPSEIEYKGKVAFVRGHLGETNDIQWTTEKLVIADDYLDEGRYEEVYALLGNAYEKFDTLGAERATKEDAKKIYGAIERRALRAAKKVVDKDLGLAKQFLELAKESREAYEKKIANKFEFSKTTWG